MLWLEIPAYAGSTSPAPAGQGPAPDHPRIRGEHRSTAGTTASRRGSSPHTRGALGILLAIFIQLGIIPAYAGSTSRRYSPAAAARDHPRIRGEHVAADGRQEFPKGSSPHTRGALVTFASPPSRAMDHPRIRGEHSGLPLAEWRRAGSSPHTRGARHARRRRRRRRRIIPAYAGSTCRRRRDDSYCRDHPRIRGEHRMAETPHQAPPRIIPAYAGSTTLVVSRDHLMPDHPRIRGEHVRGPSRQDRESGSSPHTRGARHHARLPTRLPGIIPAYAGSTHTPRTRPKPLADHPRIRGEHFNSILPALPKAGSSPHTRGAPCRRR